MHSQCLTTLSALGHPQLVEAVDGLGEGSAAVATPQVDAHVLELLSVALHTACGAAVFPNRFEIDEQEPHSRIEALSEQLIEAVHNSQSNGLNGGQENEAKVATMTIINDVCERICATLR